MRQLRRANRDTVRRLLGLHKDPRYGEVLQQVERIEPRPITTKGKLVLALGAAVAAARRAGARAIRDRSVGLLLGVADSTVRAAYHRALAARRARSAARRQTV